MAVLPRVLRSLEERTLATGTHKITFFAMGTSCSVTFAAPTAAAERDFTYTVLRWVAAFEVKYSRFLPDSLIGRINAAAGSEWIAIDAETDRMFTLCDQLTFMTQGAFDPTALPLIQLWNWKAQPAIIPDDTAIAAARELVGWNKVQRQPDRVFLPEPGMALDLGGFGKEYAVDCVAQLATSFGIRSALIDFGQDVRALGHPPGKHAWHVGLEDPNHPGACWNSVAATDIAVATSGDYRRCFVKDGRRYGHILDPRTGQPVDNGCLSVTVIAPSCTMAGVLSTSAFIIGPRDGIRLIETCTGAEACILTAKGNYETRRFQTYVTQ
ncbi:MAG: FAD:protein FMN transferase [Verrucomicrobiota bacterium]